MSVRDQIHNYYELKVAEALEELAAPKGFSKDELIDLACLALNNLPCRYFRYEVDMVFYMSGHELDEIYNKARNAVSDAIRTLEAHKANHNPS